MSSTVIDNENSDIILPQPAERASAATQPRVTPLLPKIIVGVVVVAIVGGWYWQRQSSQPSELAPVNAALSQVQTSLTKLSLEQDALTNVDGLHDSALKDLAGSVSDLKQIVSQLQTDVGSLKAEAAAEKLSAFQTELRSQGVEVESLSQRMQALEHAAARISAKATTAVPAALESGTAKATPTKPAKRRIVQAKKALPVPPAPPSIRLETIDSFGGHEFAVVLQHGSRRFMAREDEVDGWRLQQLTESGARFTHVQTGAIIQLNRPN